MENRDKKLGQFYYQWKLRGDFEKKHKKNDENVTCRGDFE